MKKYIYTLIALPIILFVACQDPEPLSPSVSRNGINNFTAEFVDDNSEDNLFSSEIDYENRIITVVFPYNYPIGSNNIINMADLSNMRVKAKLDDNVTVEPTLLFMDLTKENYITITDQLKERIVYKVVAEIRKSNATSILRYSLPEVGLNGVINDEQKTISFVSADELGGLLADVVISHGATISPDPRVTENNYDDDFIVTVTAQDGVTKTEYTVIKNIPEKVPNGIRPGSRVILWEKRLSDLGISSPNQTSGLAVTDDYVILNTRGENSVYLNSTTGAVVGTYNLNDKGLEVNYYSTSDDNNNILISNRSGIAANPSFKIWRISDLESPPELYIEWATGLQLGRKFSVKGSLDGNAIISVPVYYSPANPDGGSIARWQVVDGSLVSPTPDIVTFSAINWTTNADVVYTDPTDLSSDFFASFFGQGGSPKTFTWMNGATYVIKDQGPAISSNWIPNAVDYIVFNNNPYAIHNSVNSFTWGSDDAIYMYDLAAGNLSSTIDVVEKGAYGARALGNQNALGFGDVIFHESDNGYYLYAYVMFANGYVVCVQYDCIDM